MRAYLITNALVDALVLIAHAARLVADGASPLRQPAFVLSSLLVMALLVWTLSLLRRPRTAG